MGIACSTQVNRLIENSYRLLVGNVKARGYLEDLDVDVVI
jgi:hypothetical protein